MNKTLKKNIQNLKIIKDIKRKLYEYGFEILEEYKIEENNEYYFSVEEMMVFVDYKEKEISVSFSFTTYPHNVANNILILNEVSGIKNINVMDSFIITDDDIMLFHEDAKNYVETKTKMKNISPIKLTKKEEMIYDAMFKNINWNKCIKI